MTGNRSIVFNCFQFLAARFMMRELPHGESAKQKKKVYVQEWVLKERCFKVTSFIACVFLLFWVGSSKEGGLLNSPHLQHHGILS